MRFLHFDVETTGFLNHKRPPFIVQMAALLTDENGVEFGAIDHLIKPNGWVIPDGAAEVHGITTDIAHAKGIPIAEAMGVLKNLYFQTDFVVAFGINFDRTMLDYELARMSDNWPEKQWICVMKNMTDKCRLSKINGQKGFKWPKLKEAYQWCFNKEMTDSHTALGDVRAMKDVFFHSCWVNPPQSNSASAAALTSNPSLPSSPSLADAIPLELKSHEHYLHESYPGL